MSVHLAAHPVNFSQATPVISNPKIAKLPEQLPKNDSLCNRCFECFTQTFLFLNTPSEKASLSRGTSKEDLLSSATELSLTIQKTAANNSIIGSPTKRRKTLSPTTIPSSYVYYLGYQQPYTGFLYP